jgi:hypothetical protein
MTPEKEAAGGCPPPARSHNELPEENGTANRSRERSIARQVVPLPTGWIARHITDPTASSPVIAIGLRTDASDWSLGWEAMVMDGCTAAFASEVIGACTIDSEVRA